ncbi:MAG: penicillin-binding protein 2 [Candidatus Anoxymicrobium japonicum]|uniref:Penicillin-binding protein 2 n=1 Tax=Candidatus Anoxymicrobium japonicum TaxID=2013648 RepID=A0A2N3G7W7_9ACTN|nr:MAG: penicillin-binding protein 2 [Candidatus Anoxymicrobium japonicum]
MRFVTRTRLKIRPDETTSRRSDTTDENLQRRVAILGLVMLVAFVILFTRLWFMQIVSGNEYQKRAEGNRIREISVDAPRGRILDRNGRVLVKNRETLTISVVPAEVGEEKSIVIARLSRLLGIGQKEILYKIEKSQDPNRRAVLIKSDVDEEIFAYVHEHQREFPGVDAAARPVREYPRRDLAAHVIGYLGEINPETLKEKNKKGYRAGDEIGLSGVESTYDEDLRGKVGKYRIEVDAGGNFKREISRVEARAGLNMRTTIDQDIQTLIESALESGVKASRTRQNPEGPGKYQATGASAVVMDPKTGEIVAMASYPTFDLNDFTGGIDEKTWKALNDPKNMYPLNNRAIMSELPPGSVFKVVTAISAMDQKMFQIRSPFNCVNVFTKGPFKEYPKYCWSTHNHVDLFSGIVQSCDIVFYEIGYAFYERQLQAQGKPLWECARDFHLGRRTGVDLTSEMNGRIPSPEWKKEFNKNNKGDQVWYPGDTVNMAIGQGDILTTPLQIAYLYAGIANGGKFIRPHVVKSFEDEDGKVVKKTGIETVAEMSLDPQIVADVTQALTGVVRGKGTAAATFEGFPIDLIPVAGKTGTSEIAGKQPTAWFAGFAPAGDPKYVVTVAIEQGGHGGESAAPVARRILERLFNLPAQGEIRSSPGD